MQSHEVAVAKTSHFFSNEKILHTVYNLMGHFKRKIMVVFLNFYLKREKSYSSSKIGTIDIPSVTFLAYLYIFINRPFKHCYLVEFLEKCKFLKYKEVTMNPSYCFQRENYPHLPISNKKDFLIHSISHHCKYCNRLNAVTDRSSLQCIYNIK